MPHFLLDNPIANMPGVWFLLFYAVTIVLVLVILSSNILVFIDDSVTMPPLKIKADLDPYEIAFLKEGAVGVARAVVFRLVQRGYLEIQDEIKISQSPQTPSMEHLSSLEKAVYRYFNSPKTKSITFPSIALPADIKPWIEAYQRRSEEKHLTPSQTSRQLFQMIKWTCFAGILLLGGYKLLVAFIKGYDSLFLWGLTGLGLYLIASVQYTPLSHRGRKYLQQMESAYRNLKDRVGTLSKTESHTCLPILFALFGSDVLSQSTHSQELLSFFKQPIAAPSSNYSLYSSCSSCSSSSSCSSCGSSCGGGCGGCGS